MHRLSKRFSKSKILITALTAISVIFGTAFAVSAAENYSIYDAAQIQMYIARLTDLPQDKDYDANNDGKVDIFDVTEIQRLLSHSGENDSNASNKQETTQPTEATTAPAEINFTYYDDYENLGIGETFDLFAEISGDNADTVWQSSNEDVASITSASDSLAVITAKSTGTAVITATISSGSSDTFKINVKPQSTKLSLNATELELGIGETFDLNSYNQDPGTYAYHRDYYSDNTDIAEVAVAGGLVTAKATGTTTVKCIMSNGIYTSCTVRVLPQSMKIGLNAYEINLGVGETFDLNSYNQDPGTYAYHRDYYSDNTDIADVTMEYGIVTANSPGTTTIKCILSNGVYASCTVNVFSEPQSVSFENVSQKIKVGERCTVSCTVDFESGTESYEYESSNPEVIEINGAGGNKAQIFAKKQGKADIFAKLYNGVQCKASIEVKGSVVKCLDVSVWQDNVDFNKVKSDGYDYVIIRAGYGKDSGQQDSKFNQNYYNAKAAGLKVGAYWYSYAESAFEAREEAYNCLKTIGGKSFDLPIYYDLEESYQSSCDLMSLARNWCSVMENNGYEAGVYTFLNWWNDYLDRYELIDEGYSVWLAQIDGDMSNIDADIHQYTFTEQVDGISGNSDCSYIYNLNIIQ
ncbi:MAG: GH25 family lysozyme [Ruminococcus sp.]|nr:GH25 family lysozyme [Ruminococcus sp.]